MADEVCALIRRQLIHIATDLENGRICNVDIQLGNTVAMMAQLSRLTTDIDNILELVQEALVIWTEHQQFQDYVENRSREPSVVQGVQGTPKYNIPYDTLEYLVGNHFTVKDIASMTGVSPKTINRRMQEYGLRARDTYSTISECDLNDMVRGIVNDYPDVGYKTITGISLSKGHRVQQLRIRESLRNADPEGVLFRRLFLSSFRLQRRSYSVSAPLSLWHLDGNHKLVRWRFVIHGCIDGYSRLPVFLQINTNNMAETVLSAFQKAVADYGLPRCVRSDKGEENIKVAEYMVIQTNGSTRCFIAGRSVHNQRIERLWRELWAGVTHLYYQLFYSMKADGILEIDNELHLLALHLKYKQWIQNHLDQFREALIRRPLRTEGNRTPLQLWIRGQICIPDNYFENETDLENYGIDYDGPVSNEPTYVIVPAPPEVHRLEEHQQDILNIINKESSQYGVDLYLEVLQLLNTFVM